MRLMYKARLSATLLAILVTVPFMAASCTRTEANKWKIVASFTAIKTPTMTAIREELERAAQRDSRIELRIDDFNGLVDAQVRALSDRDGLGDLVIVVPDRSAQLDRVIHDLHALGLPVLTLRQDIGHDSFNAAFLPDDIAIGRAAADWVVKTLADGGNVVALKGSMTSRQSQERQRGFLQGLTRRVKSKNASTANDPVSLVYESECDGTRAGAQRAMRDALIANSKIDAVFAHSDEIAYGAYEAAVASDRDRDIVILGVGGLQEAGMKFVADGILAATIETALGADEAINYALRILSGEVILAQRVRLASKLYTLTTLSTGGSPVR